MRSSRTKLRINSDPEEEITWDLGQIHFGPRTKSLRTWRTKLSLNSDLEDEIEIPSNSDLEDEIEIRQDEIENRPGRN